MYSTGVFLQLPSWTGPSNWLCWWCLGLACFSLFWVNFRLDCIDMALKRAFESSTFPCDLIFCSEEFIWSCLSALLLFVSESEYICHTQKNKESYKTANLLGWGPEWMTGIVVWLFLARGKWQSGLPEVKRYRLDAQGGEHALRLLIHKLSWYWSSTSL